MNSYFYDTTSTSKEGALCGFRESTSCRAINVMSSMAQACKRVLTNTIIKFELNVSPSFCLFFSVLVPFSVPLIPQRLCSSSFHGDQGSLCILPHLPIPHSIHIVAFFSSGMTQLTSPGAHSGTEKAEIRPSSSNHQRQGYRHFNPSSSSSNPTNANRRQKSDLEDADLTRSSTSEGQRFRVITFEERSSKESPLPPSPPPPPPHDYDDTPVQLQHWHLNDEKDDHKLPPLPPTPSPPPPPLPSKRTFYQTALDPSKKSSSTPFIEAFMARHPQISRHRRRFAALIFTVVILLLLLVVLLSVLLTRKKSDDLGDYGDGTTATDEELARYNRGKSRPPINRSKDDGWARQGQGEGTFYGKAAIHEMEFTF